MITYNKIDSSSFYTGMSGYDLVSQLNSFKKEVDMIRDELNSIMAEAILLSPEEVKIKNVYEMTYEEYSELTERL